MLVACSWGLVNGLLATGLRRLLLANWISLKVLITAASAGDTLYHRPEAADVYLPDQQMVAAPQSCGIFESWYKRDMTSFLEREFNLDGVRPPIAVTSFICVL